MWELSADEWVNVRLHSWHDTGLRPQYFLIILFRLANWLKVDSFSGNDDEAREEFMDDAIIVDAVANVVGNINFLLIIIIAVGSLVIIGWKLVCIDKQSGVLKKNRI